MDTIIEIASREAFEKGGEILRSGGLVAFPTETVYGLGGNALDADAAAKIYAAKGRPSDNPLIVHLAKVEDAVKYCHIDDAFLKLAEHFMPGPLTVVLPKKDSIPLTVTGGLDTVAIRIPADKNARALIEAAGVPVAAPSANASGKPSPTCAAHVAEDLRGRIDMIIDGGDCEIGLESTIVKIVDGHLTMLRPGGITAEMLRAVFGEITLDKAITEQLADGERPQAPGMKYRHYAPDTKIVIVDADDTAFAGFLRRQAKSSRIGALLFDDECEKFSGICAETLSLGVHSEEAEAHSLFKKLRELDTRNCDIFYIRMPKKEGIGLAVYNRVMKAAGYEIIVLDSQEDEK